MTLEVYAFGFLSYVHDFLVIFHVGCVFNWGLFLGGILNNFGGRCSTCWSQWITKMLSTESMQKLASKVVGSEELCIVSGIPSPSGLWSTCIYFFTRLSWFPSVLSRSSPLWCLVFFYLLFHPPFFFPLCNVSLPSGSWSTYIYFYIRLCIFPTVMCRVLLVPGLHSSTSIPAFLFVLELEFSEAW